MVQNNKINTDSVEQQIYIKIQGSNGNYSTQGNITVKDDNICKKQDLWAW